MITIVYESFKKSLSPHISKMGGKSLHLEILYRMVCSRLTSVRRIMFVNKADDFMYIFAAA